ncbi:MAG TPA: hypothetical protein VFJ82_13310 [Longimicrobium sp.]|nr:hypothetical protein [Longimicrobium sp.]
MPAFLRVLLIVAIPAVTFVIPGKLMERWSGRAQVRRALDRAVADGTLQREDAAYLNLRLRGYSLSAFRRYFGAMDDRTRSVEAKFLEMDLVFPFIYGGGLAAALLMAWAALGRPVHPGWVVAPVLILVLADWTENLATLGQIRRWNAGGPAALQPAWVRVASLATTVKCVFIAVTVLLVVAMAAWLLVRSATGRSAVAAAAR